MTKYVALLRGIGPGNPNMHGSKLVSALQDLGLSNVRSFISSGNVLFESTKSPAQLEAMMEKAWPKKLGFSSMTIVKSQQNLQRLVANNTFKKLEHNQNNYSLITFFKSPTKIDFKFPYTPEGKAFTILGAGSQALWSSIDLTNTKTPDLMSWLEKQFGKDITSRTPNTISRILQKMG